MSAPSRRGRPFALADCLHCGEEAKRTGDPAAARRWASAHAERYPGHQVHVTTESVRVYEVEARDA